MEIGSVLIKQITRYCCKTMERAVEAKAVVVEIRSHSVQIFGPRQLLPEDQRIFNMNFCPFCGEKVEFK